MHDHVQALADALADAAAMEEEVASELTAMAREAQELGRYQLQTSLLRMARVHRAAAIQHRAQRGSLLHHYAAESMDDEDPDPA